MSPMAINTRSALAISVIISFMAILKESKARALVYSLPIPITIAVIATGGTVSSFNIVGVLLAGVVLFLVMRFIPLKNVGQQAPVMLAD